MAEDGENAGEIIAGAQNRVIQVRKPSLRTWTRAKRTTFLELLATTCNVEHAARECAMSGSGAHALRRRDPAFAAAWEDALQQGYARIEAKLLARAIGEVPDPMRAIAPEGTPFDPELALRVLGMAHKKAAPQRPRGGARSKRVTIDQVEASLTRKLDALAKRLKETG